MAIESKMDDCEIRDHLDFLGSTEADAGPNRSLKPSAGTPILEFIKDFYDHLFRTPASPGIIPANGATQANGAAQDTLEGTQAGSAKSHLDGYPDTGHVNRRAAIGPPHSRPNITPQ